MKKIISFLVAVVMIMQIFVFTVSAAAAPARVYWSDEMPGRVEFTMVNGAEKYRLKLYKDNHLVTNTTHSYGEWISAVGHHEFLEDICENGSGTYRVEVGVEDGSNNFTSSENYVYNKPTKTLAKPTNVVYNKNGQYVTWNAVSGAAFYDICFCYSIDGGESFCMMSSWQIDPQWEGCVADLSYDIEYVEEEYQWAAEEEGVDVDDMIRAIQIVAYPRNLNDANLSYSDYVTFDGSVIDTPDQEESTELGDLQWGDVIGVIKFMPASDKDGYYIKLYKDDVEVDGTWYFTEPFEKNMGVEYENFIYSMVDNGSGEYRFSVCSVDDDYNFNNDILYSEPYYYNKQPTVAKATNLSYNDNIIRWTNTDGNVSSYAIAYYLTYDNETYHQLLVGYSEGEKTTVYQSDMDYFNSTIESWHESNSNKYNKEKAKLVAAVYSVPYDRNYKEMSKSDYVVLQGEKDLVKVDRSSITDGRYIDSSKIVYDLGLMKNVYENSTANVTKGEICEIVVKMLGAEDFAKDKNNETSRFDDVQTGTALNGYVKYVYGKGVVNAESGSTFGVATEMTFEQIAKVLVSVLGFDSMAKNYGGYPYGYLTIASRYKILSGVSVDIGEKVTREQLGRLVANALEVKMMEQVSWGIDGPTYDITGKTLLFNYLGYIRILGTGYADTSEIGIEKNILFSKDYPEGVASANVKIENCDYDAIELNGKRTMFYIKDSKNICSIQYFGGQVVINGGDAETSSRNVTLNIKADGYTKYKIEDGAYFPITSKVSYVLPSAVHGNHTVNITLANDDETRTQKVSDSINLNNMHKLTYMADGKVFAQFDVGCGAKPNDLYTEPQIEGYWFDGWDQLPPTEMPDKDVVITAKLSPYTRIRGILTYNGEVVANKRVYIHDAWHTTGEDGSFNTCLPRGSVGMINITYDNMPKAVYVDLSDKAFDLGIVDITSTGTKTDIEENTVTSVDGLENIFTEEDKIYAETEGNNITVNVAVKSAEKTDAITEKEAETNYKVETLVDIALTKVKKGAEESQTTINETDDLVEFDFVVPERSRGRSSYMVIREHNGEVQILTTNPNADGEYIVINQNVIVVYAKKFSLYGIATKEIVSASKTDNGINLAIALNEQVVPGNALMIVKAYNSRGVQVAMKTVNVTSTYNDTVFLRCEDAIGYKIMFWDGFNSIKPQYATLSGEL